MDNPAPDQPQNPPLPNSAPLPVPPPPSSPQPSSPLASTPAPAGGGSTKESEPADLSRPSEAGADQYWENYAREIELEKEVAEIGGIEKIESGEVKVPEPMAKEMGIKPTVEITTPIAKVVDFTVRGVALTDEQLGTGLTKPTSSGFRWLVEWFIYQLLKAHFLVKRVKGKIFRAKLSVSDQGQQK
jgi:hypothetical protein